MCLKKGEGGREIDHNKEYVNAAKFSGKTKCERACAHALCTHTHTLVNLGLAPT